MSFKLLNTNVAQPQKNRTHRRRTIGGKDEEMASDEAAYRQKSRRSRLSHRAASPELL